MILTALSFLRLLTAYLLYGEIMSVRLCEREIKNEEGKQKSFPSDVKWIRKDLYQIVTHLTSRLHTHPPTNVNLTFVVAV